MDGFTKGVAVGFMFGVLLFAGIIAAELANIVRVLERIVGSL